MTTIGTLDSESMNLPLAIPEEWRVLHVTLRSYIGQTCTGAEATFYRADLVAEAPFGWRCEKPLYVVNSSIHSAERAAQEVANAAGVEVLDLTEWPD